MPDSAVGSRRALAERLRTRRAEVEAALLTRVHAIGDLTGVEDPLYREGLRAAVAAALDYGVDSIETGAERARPVPLELLAQARQAARSRVSLDAVLRRYFAGYALLCDFVLEEAEGTGMRNGASPKRLLQDQAILFDRLLGAISDEYARETGGAQPSFAAQRRFEKVRGLLAGEPLDTAELAYDFDAVHLGAVATGDEAQAALRQLAASLGCRLLLVDPRPGSIWAWLATRQGFDAMGIRSALAGWPVQLALSLGEPSEGLTGWRLTHRQARAGLPIALRRPGEPVRYAEVALLTSCLQDDLLRASLGELFLEPLGKDPETRELHCETLHAYFAVDCNISSAAASLGLSRQTVRSRLRAVEEQLGRPLASCSVELRMALELHQHHRSDLPVRT